MGQIGQPVRRYTVVPLEEPVSPTAEPATPPPPNKAARMRDGPFKSQEIALEAGKVALREFLELLEFGQENDA